MNLNAKIGVDSSVDSDAKKDVDSDAKKGGESDVKTGGDSITISLSEYDELIHYKNMYVDAIGEYDRKKYDHIHNHANKDKENVNNNPKIII